MEIKVEQTKNPRDHRETGNPNQNTEKRRKQPGILTPTTEKGSFLCKWNINLVRFCGLMGKQWAELAVLPQEDSVVIVN